MTLAQGTDDFDLDHYTDLSVGDILRKTRDYYGLSLDQVEQALRIRASQLYAIETGNLKEIPGRVYAIGFVRTYSEYLGLDGDKMVHLFKVQSVGKKAPPPVNFPVVMPDHQEWNVHIIIAAVTVLLLVISYLAIFHAPAKNIEAIPPVPQALKEKTTRMMNPQSLIPVPKEPEPIVHKMELKVIADSWVEIRTKDGKVLVSQVLKKGDLFIVPDSETLTMDVGNAGGIMVVRKGKEEGALGGTGEVKKNITLSASKAD